MKGKILLDFTGGGILISFAVFTFLLVSLACPALGLGKAEKNKLLTVYDVVPSAQITKVNCYFKEFKGRETIHFEISVKNISAEPKRFKLKIFILDGPSAASLYPRSEKPPVLAPGKVYMYPLPLVFFDKLPEEFTIKVEEV
jgi:hypothetical protein